MADIDWKHRFEHFVWVAQGKNSLRLCQMETKHILNSARRCFNQLAGYYGFDPSYDSDAGKKHRGAPITHEETAREQAQRFVLLLKKVEQRGDLPYPLTPVLEKMKNTLLDNHRLFMAGCSTSQFKIMAQSKASDAFVPNYDQMARYSDRNLDLDQIASAPPANFGQEVEQEIDDIQDGDLVRVKGRSAILRVISCLDWPRIRLHAGVTIDAHDLELVARPGLDFQTLMRQSTVTVEDMDRIIGPGQAVSMDRSGNLHPTAHRTIDGSLVWE